MKRETLEKMSISQLRSLDIRNGDDEKLVQEILDAKIAAEPNTNLQNRVTLPSSATDNMNAEKEKALQEELDRKNGKIVPENHTPNVPEKETTTTETNPAQAPVTVTQTRFCNFCDSKGVRHKKNCTRELKANIINQDV